MAHVDTINALVIFLTGIFFIKTMSSSFLFRFSLFRFMTCYSYIFIYFYFVFFLLVVLKAPWSISVEIFHGEISLPASHCGFVIVNDHDWPTLI